MPVKNKTIEIEGNPYETRTIDSSAVNALIDFLEENTKGPADGVALLITTVVHLFERAGLSVEEIAKTVEISIRSSKVTSEIN